MGGTCSRTTFCFGLQVWKFRFLGRKLDENEVEEDAESERWSNAYLKKIGILKREFNFRHMDGWNNGGNWILDENKNVPVIDLEHWE